MSPPSPNAGATVRRSVCLSVVKVVPLGQPGAIAGLDVSFAERAGEVDDARGISPGRRLRPGETAGVVDRRLHTGAPARHSVRPSSTPFSSDNWVPSFVWTYPSLNGRCRRWSRHQSTANAGRVLRPGEPSRRRWCRRLSTTHRRSCPAVVTAVALGQLGAIARLTVSRAGRRAKRTSSVVSYCRPCGISFAVLVASAGASRMPQLLVNAGEAFAWCPCACGPMVTNIRRTGPSAVAHPSRYYDYRRALSLRDARHRRRMLPARAISPLEMDRVMCRLTAPRPDVSLPSPGPLTSLYHPRSPHGAAVWIFVVRLESHGPSFELRKPLRGVYLFLSNTRRTGPSAYVRLISLAVLQHTARAAQLTTDNDNGRAARYGWSTRSALADGAPSPCVLLDRRVRPQCQCVRCREAATRHRFLPSRISQPLLCSFTARMLVRADPRSRRPSFT